MRSITTSMSIDIITVSRAPWSSTGCGLAIPPTIEVFFRSERVGSHVRSYQRGAHATLREHMPKSHLAHAEAPKLVSFARQPAKRVVRCNPARDLRMRLRWTTLIDLIQWPAVVVTVRTQAQGDTLQLLWEEHQKAHG